ncbi:MAG TPA: hypothetical protein VKD24_10235 [Candidatus Angelobacter sp.]|nr:hypothetical protein [Candidatus Angelobacter sp.]
MMNVRHGLRVLISAVTLVLAPLAAVQASGGAAVGRDHHDDDDSTMPLRETETIRKSFAGAHKLLDVDNVFGSIEVVGGQGDQVQLVITKTIRAESRASLEAAKKEVTLEVTDAPDLLKFYVNGPFRCNCNCGCNDGSSGWHRDRDYVVKMDFQLQVPSRIDLKLRTVNSGRINVRDVIGNFSVNNVNGAIDLENVGGGAARARTVNGGVKVVFRENPKQNSEFGTINGPIELYFTRDLSADFRFKNFNGGVYSDFEMTSLPALAPTTERHDGKFVFRTSRFTGGRVGSGGLEIKADNLNGDIRVLERHE